MVKLHLPTANPWYMHHGWLPWNSLHTYIHAQCMAVIIIDLYWSTDQTHQSMGLLHNWLRSTNRVFSEPRHHHEVALTVETLIHLYKGTMTMQWCIAVIWAKRLRHAHDHAISTSPTHLKKYKYNGLCLENIPESPLHIVDTIKCPDNHFELFYWWKLPLNADTPLFCSEGCPLYGSHCIMHASQLIARE